MANDIGIETERIGAAALMLAEAHAHRARFVPFAHAYKIGDRAVAYDVQDAYVRRVLEAEQTVIGGFKIGITNAKMQQMLGIDTPVAGTIPAGWIRSAPSAIHAASFVHLGLEFEIAAKLGRDFPARAKPYGQDEVARDLQVAPGVELIDDRSADYAMLDALSLIADNVYCAGAVIGAWREPPTDLAGILGVVSCDGQEIDRGHGRDVLGHPLTALTWLVNFRARTDRPLRQDDIVLTGSLVRPQFRTGPCTYRYELAGLGSMEVAVTR